MISLFEQYSWRKKNRLLWIGAVLFCLLAYQLAIRPTMRLWHEYRALVAGELAMQANLEELAVLRNEVLEIGHLFGDSVGGEPPGNGLSEPEQIVYFAGHNNTTVRRLPASEWFGTADSRIAYTEYQIEGRFVNLLKLLRDVERYQGIYPLSVDLKKQHNPISGDSELILKLRTVRLAEKK